MKSPLKRLHPPIEHVAPFVQEPPKRKPDFWSRQSVRIAELILFVVLMALAIWGIAQIAQINHDLEPLRNAIKGFTCYPNGICR